MLVVWSARRPGRGPRRGKIDEVERSSREDRAESSGHDHWWALELAGDVLKLIFSTPSSPGQGYLPYPYAGVQARESFVLRDVKRGRRFGSLSLGRFSDASTTLSGTQFAFEGANDLLHYGVEYARYEEPKANETDRVSTYRGSLGVAAPLGGVGFAPVALGVRAVALDNGATAAGADIEVAARLFPLRPLGFVTTLRLGGMHWSGGSEFLVRETNTSASVFAGRLEISAGWHWLKLGRASAFAGPRLAARVWF